MRHSDWQTTLARRRELSTAERRQLDAHLAECAECRATAEAYTLQSALLQALPSLPPPAAIRQAVLAPVPASPRRIHLPAFSPLAGLALAVALAAGLVLAFRAQAPPRHRTSLPTSQATSRPMSVAKSAPATSRPRPFHHKPTLGGHQPATPVQAPLPTGVPTPLGPSTGLASVPATTPPAGAAPTLTVGSALTIQPTATSRVHVTSVRPTATPLFNLPAGFSPGRAPVPTPTLVPAGRGEVPTASPLPTSIPAAQPLVPTPVSLVTPGIPAAQPSPTPPRVTSAAQPAPTPIPVPTSPAP